MMPEEGQEGMVGIVGDGLGPGLEMTLKSHQCEGGPSSQPGWLLKRATICG